jgi:hypothetical protein
MVLIQPDERQTILPDKSSESQDYSNCPQAFFFGFQFKPGHLDQPGIQTKAA